jgi:N-formylglutamate amidohydrolase
MTRIFAIDFLVSNAGGTICGAGGFALVAKAILWHEYGCMDTHLPPVPSFIVARPEQATRPVVVASPHSGRRYDPAFLEASRLDRIGLRKSEDSFVDELFAEAPALGVPLLMANFPRAYCDVNREAWELDPGMFEDRLPPHVNTASPRVAAGLGTIARVVACGEPIYRAKLKFAEAERRIACCWTPYHRALGDLIGETCSRFGGCLLVDCHSMPESSSNIGGANSRRFHGPDIVLGDAFGTSCAQPLVDHAERVLRQHGLTVRRNDPYAGGYITRHYGQPREHAHAMQIEIARSLYMNEQHIEKHQGFAAIQSTMTDLVRQLSLVAADYL